MIYVLLVLKAANVSFAIYKNNFLAKILISLKLVAGQKPYFIASAGKPRNLILVFRRNSPTMFQSEERPTNTQTTWLSENREGWLRDM